MDVKKKIQHNRRVKIFHATITLGVQDGVYYSSTMHVTYWIVLKYLTYIL